MSRKRVLIVDDHELFRRGLRDLLSEFFEVAAEAGGGKEAVERAVASQPDVVVMDVMLPGIDGIEATRQIRERLPETNVIMMSANDDQRSVLESIRAGARGYIVKDESTEAMVRAVRNVADGMAYLPPSVTRNVIESLASNAEPAARRTSSRQMAILSPRESQILRLLAAGKHNKDIGDELHISSRTVAHHVSNIYSKLRVTNRAQAIAYAARKQLLNP